MAEPGDLKLFALILVLFPLCLAAMLFFVGNLLAFAGGWKALAAAYPPSGEPPGARFEWQSMRLAWVNYNHCVNLIAGRSELHLSVVLFLRMGHRPISIPWSEITATPHQGWVLPYVHLEAAKVPGVRIRLHRALAEELLAAAGRFLPKDGPSK